MEKLGWQREMNLTLKKEHERDKWKFVFMESGIEYVAIAAGLPLTPL